ncbi:MAG: hypothetical protein QOH49_4079 [Acidobacteriota bacterium]|jgi:hypothetical protein|nr:hypothetical protein [Acidobacteriota bacterium]
MFSVLSAIVLTVITIVTIPPQPADTTDQVQCSAPAVADANGNLISDPCSAPVGRVNPTRKPRQTSVPPRRG